MVGRDDTGAPFPRSRLPAARRTPSGRRREGRRRQVAQDATGRRERGLGMQVPWQASTVRVEVATQPNARQRPVLGNRRTAGCRACAEPAAVAFGAGQVADGDLVGLGSAFDAAFAGGGEVVVPVGICGSAPLVANTKLMLSSASCGRYINGLTYSRPLFRPRWCTRTIGPPSKRPPTRPSLPRNSAMVFEFQSVVSVTSCSRCVELGRRARQCRWPPFCFAQADSDGLEQSSHARDVGIGR
jgi:hypothetical protein